jgi:hypothetical protein
MNEIVMLYWDIAVMWAVMLALGALVIGMSAIGLLMVAAELRYQWRAS